MKVNEIEGFICISALDGCKMTQYSYGEICVGCNFCKRFGNGRPMTYVDSLGESGCYVCPVCENSELNCGDKYCGICGNKFDNPIPSIDEEGDHT